MSDPADVESSTERDHVAAAVAIVLDLIPETWDDVVLQATRTRGGLQLAVGNDRHQLDPGTLPPELHQELDGLYRLHAASDEAWRELRISITYDFDQENWRYDLERLFSA